VVKVSDGSGYVRTIVTSTRGGVDGLLYIAMTNNNVLHGSLQGKLSTVIYVSIILYSAKLTSFPSSSSLRHS